MTPVDLAGLYRDEHVLRAAGPDEDEPAHRSVAGVPTVWCHPRGTKTRPPAVTGLSRSRAGTWHRRQRRRTTRQCAGGRAGEAPDDPEGPCGRACPGAREDERPDAEERSV